MALKSFDLPDVDPFDYIGEPDVAQVKTEVQKLNEIVPSDAFPPDQMKNLKDKIGAQLESFGTSLPPELAGLSLKLQTITPKTLSSVLHDSGVNPVDFNVASFDVSLESMTNLQNSIMGFEAAENGGCDALVTALNTSVDLSKLSTADIKMPSIPSLAFFEASAEDLIREAAKTANEIAEDIEQEINSVKDNLTTAFDNLSETVSTSISSAENYIKDVANSIENAYSTQIKKTLLGVKDSLSSLNSIAESCGDHLQKTMESKIENNKKSVETLSKKLTEASPNVVNEIQKNHKQALDTLKGLVSKEINLKKQAQIAAFIKNYEKNNPNSTPSEVENAVKRQIATASKYNDELIKRKMDEAQKKVQHTEAKFKDLSKKSKTAIANSGIEGRPLKGKEQVVESAIEWSGEKKTFDKSYFGGPYNAEIANHINTLHPKIRQRFADAMKDITTDEILIKSGIRARVTSSTRSYAKQQELYNYYKPRGTPVAKPGNSWHNFACAIDIQVIVNGTKKSKTSNYYTGIPRQIFAKYGLINPFANDYIHFQPKELPLSPKTIKSKLLINGSTVNEDTVGALLK